VVGASGAISGLMGTGIRLLPAAPLGPARRGTDGAALFPPGSELQRGLVAMNVVVGIWGLGLVPAGQQSPGRPHLGGYFAGLLLADAFDRLRPAVQARDAD